MTEPDKPKQPRPDETRKESEYEEAVENTFPASDPPSTAQPGSGITKTEKLPDPVTKKD